MKTNETIINETGIKRTNERYDSIIRNIFGTYPGKYLRKVLADNEVKFGDILSKIIFENNVHLINCIKYKSALNEFLQESAKMMHQYMGYSMSDLPAVCIIPYLSYLEEQNKEEARKIDRRLLKGSSIDEVIQFDGLDRDIVIGLVLTNIL